MAETSKTTQVKKTTKVAVTPKSSSTVKKVPAKKAAEKKDDKMITEIKASARFIKVSPRKVRLVIDLIKKMSLEETLDRIKMVKKQSSMPLEKLIRSAVANAENNFQIDKKDLFIKKLTVDDGPTLKRFRPRAHGRSAMIRKRTSHIDLILGVKDGAARKAPAKKLENKSAEVKIVNPEDIKHDKSDSDGPKQGGSVSGKADKGFMKGVFQRKTG